MTVKREPDRIAWLAENPRRGVSRPGRYFGCVISGDQEVPADHSFADAESALAWAGARADVVLIRPAGSARYLSAGRQDPPWWAPRWGTTSGDDRPQGRVPREWPGLTADDGWTEVVGSFVSPAELEDETDGADGPWADVEDTVSVYPFPSWDRDQEELS